MEQNSVLTIAIPTYNRGSVLNDNVLKMLKNPSLDFEIVISDNASPDNTQQLILAINDPRVKYSRNKENIGAVKNINHVLSLSTGKYIYLISDEDYIPNDGLSKILRLVSQQGYSLILGKIISSNSIFKNNSVDTVFKKGQDSIVKLSFSHPYISGIIYRHSIIRDYINNPYNTFIYPHEILISYSLLNANEDSIYINTPICFKGVIQESHIEEINEKKFNHPYNRVEQFLYKKAFVEKEYPDNITVKEVTRKLEKSMGIELAVILFRGFSLKVLYYTIRKVYSIKDVTINKRVIWYSFFIYLFNQLRKNLKLFLKRKISKFFKSQKSL